MNSFLAQIYGTGLDKTASAGDEYVDLNHISAADLLQGLEDGTLELPDGGFEKEAGEIDLSQLTGSELLEIMGELEADDNAVFEKMASEGDFEYWDAAGRIMAHAYNDEMSKVASDDVIDLDAIDGATMMALIESGEYDVIDLDEGLDKTAFLKKKTWRRIGTTFSSQSGRNKAYNEAREAAVKASAKKNQAAYKAAREQGMTPAQLQEVMKRGGSGRARFDKAGYKGEKKFLVRRGKQAAGAAAGLGALGIGGTGAALYRRNRN